jgi:hypothetical protein
MRLSILRSPAHTIINLRGDLDVATAEAARAAAGRAPPRYDAAGP